jgi:hypothetical protein
MQAVLLVSPTPPMSSSSCGSQCFVRLPLIRPPLHQSQTTASSDDHHINGPETYPFLMLHAATERQELISIVNEIYVIATRGTARTPSYASLVAMPGNSESSLVRLNSHTFLGSLGFKSWSALNAKSYSRPRMKWHILLPKDIQSHQFCPFSRSLLKT